MKPMVSVDYLKTGTWNKEKSYVMVKPLKTAPLQSFIELRLKKPQKSRPYNFCSVAKMLQVILHKLVTQIPHLFTLIHVEEKDVYIR